MTDAFLGGFICGVILMTLVSVGTILYFGRKNRGRPL